MKRLLALALALCLLLALGTVCAFADEQEDAKANPITLKVAVKSSATAANSVATQRWVDAVNAADCGIEMLLYTDASLGSETEVVQQIIMGEPLIINADPTHLEAYAPELALLNGPYFVESLEDFDYVVQTEWFAEQMELLKENNFFVINADMHFGQRHLLAIKPVHTPADLNGLKIRSQPAEISMATVEGLGGTPVPLAFSEIFEALNNKVVDGEENPLNTIYNAKHHETPAKYISLTGHTSTLTMYTMNYGVWNSLTEYQQKVLTETAHEAFTYYNEVLYPEATQEALDAFASDGAVVNEDVVIAAFKESCKSVYDLIDTNGVYEKVQEQIAELKNAA